MKFDGTNKIQESVILSPIPFNKGCFHHVSSLKNIYIVGSRGASQLGGYLLGNPPGYKANKL